MLLRKNIWIFTLLCVILLSGCSLTTKGNVVSENAQYMIIEDNGIYSLRYRDGDLKDFWENTSGSSISPPTISFASVSEMKDCIEQGLFSEEDLIGMQLFQKNSRGETLICDLNHLLDATFPDNVILRDVTWYGQTYTFGLGGVHSGFSGSIKPISQDYYNQEIASYKHEDNPKLKILSKTSVEDRNATVYVCRNKTNGFSFRDILYTYTDGDKTIFFAEQYNFSDIYADVPSRICFYGYMNGQYFEGSISGLRQRPSYEWLQAFGLKPYVETESE